MRMAILAASAAAAAGCGSATIDADKRANEIKQELYEQTGLEIDSVTCPGDVPCEKGTRFKCTAAAEGGEVVVAVNQPTDKCEIRWTIERGTVSSAKLEDQIEQAFRDQTTSDAFVDCGRRYRVAITGREFNCEIENRKGEIETIVARMEDDLGNVYWKLDR